MRAVPTLRLALSLLSAVAVLAGAERGSVLELQTVGQAAAFLASFEDATVKLIAVLPAVPANAAEGTKRALEQTATEMDTVAASFEGGRRDVAFRMTAVDDVARHLNATDLEGRACDRIVPPL
eukprot:SAG11_NODE_8753_length_980_cov_0.869467_1_plen_123_part_00